MSNTTSPAITDKVHYQAFNNPQAATTIMGVRGVTNSEKVYVSGTIAAGMTHGQLYEGHLSNEGLDGT